MNKAWYVEACGIRAVTLAQNGKKARYRCLLAVREGGYVLEFKDIAVRRAPEYDSVIGQYPTGCISISVLDEQLEETDT